MSELQTAITNLQLKHSELVAAVKSYPGTVAGAANAAFGEASVEQRKARDTIRNLRNQIENDGQSLILDWEHNVAVVNGEGRDINEVVTFSRSTGGGRFGPDGKYEWLEAGVPRIDYDPETGECRGLLVEEQRTNRVPWSTDLTKWDRSTPNVTATLTTDPYAGEVSVIHTDGQGTEVALGLAAVFQGNSTSSFQILFKPVQGSGTVAFGLRSNRPTVTIGKYNPVTDVLVAERGVARLARLRDGWRIAYIENLAVGDASYETGLSIGYIPGDNATVNRLYVKHVQAETGAFSTSCIPTEGSAVTRAADNARLVGAFSWWNPTEFTLFSEYSTTSRRFYPWGYSTGGKTQYLNYSFDGAIAFSNGQSNGALSLGLGVPLIKSGFSVNSSGAVTLRANGKGPYSRTNWAGFTGQISSSAVTLVGAQGGAAHIKRHEYYPRVLSDSELQELTSL